MPPRSRTQPRPETKKIWRKKTGRQSLFSLGLAASDRDEEDFEDLIGKQNLFSCGFAVARSLGQSRGRLRGYRFVNRVYSVAVSQSHAASVKDQEDFDDSTQPRTGTKDI